MAVDVSKQVIGRQLGGHRSDVLPPDLTCTASAPCTAPSLPQWYLGYLQNNTSVLGNCSYAETAGRREEYALKCDGFNDPSGELGIMQASYTLCTHLTHLTLLCVNLQG
jgi:hypothetical protein